MSSTDEQRRYFDRVASGYDRRFLRARWPRNQERKAQAVAASLGPAALRGTVVELGCGTGQIAELLLETAPELTYVGVDVAAEMLDVARLRLARFGSRAELRPAPGAGLPLERGAADAVFGVDVLHHVESPPATLAELRGALRADAPLVFLEANPRFPVTAAMGLLQREERGVLRIGIPSLRRWLAQAGLAQVDVRYGGLYTPPGPNAVTPLLDALDRAAAATPGIRALALYVEAAARAPSAP